MSGSRLVQRLHLVVADRCGHNFGRKCFDFDWFRYFIRCLRAPAGLDSSASRRLPVLCRSGFVSRRATPPCGRSLPCYGVPSFRSRRFLSCRTSPSGSCGFGCGCIRLASLACHLSHSPSAVYIRTQTAVRVGAPDYWAQSTRQCRLLQSTECRSNFWTLRERSVRGPAADDRIYRSVNLPAVYGVPPPARAAPAAVLAGDIARAERFLNEPGRRGWPVVQALRSATEALIEIQRRNPRRALEELIPSAPYELSYFTDVLPISVRGLVWRTFR